MDLKDSSSSSVQCVKDKLVDPGDPSSAKTIPDADPRWPYLKKWSVTLPPSPQQSQSVPPPSKSTTLPETENLSQPLMISCGPEPGKEVTPSSCMSDPQSQMLGSDVSLAPATSSPSPSLGAWTIPLKMSTFDSMETIIRDQGPNSHSVLSDSSLWPALSKQVERKPLAPSGTSASVRKMESNPIIKAASQEYPWAAKMKSVCNLNRVTVPDYLEDGTPKVIVPSHVLLQGIQNQKEYVVGQFYRCSAPPGGLIHAVVTRIWGKKCRIFTKKLGESSYLFHIPDDATRKFVIQRGLWHVDDCLMFVSAWTPAETITLPEIKTIPVWLSLKNIPNQLYSIEGIKWIASGIGEPLLTYKPWLDPTLMGEAKILVEIKLDRPFAQRVAIEDESGFVSMVDVLYSWLPSKCARCGQLGHKASRCLRQPLDPSRSTKTSSPTSGNVESSVNLACETESLLVDKEERDTSLTNSVLDVTAPEAPTSIVAATSDSVMATEATIKLNDQNSIDEDKSKLESNQDFSFKEKVGQGSPNTVSERSSTRSLTGNTTSNSHTPLVSSKETPSSLKQVSTNSAPADGRIRRSLSSSNLLTNRFSSLESSDEEDETLVSDEELDPKELLSPSGKVFLRERPVKPSTKAKEMQTHSTARGRGSRNRGNRGRGNRGGRG